MVFMCFLGSSALADVITFDDITSTNTYEKLDSYNGLNFDNGYIVNKNVADFDPTIGPHNNYINSTVSGDYGLVISDESFNRFNEQTLTISSNNTFSLNSGYFTSIFKNFVTVYVEGTTATGIVFDTFLLNTEQQFHEFVGFDDLYDVSFSVAGVPFIPSLFYDDHIVIDNLDIDTSAVPIPGAVWLLGCGFLSLLGLKRGKK